MEKELLIPKKLQKELPYKLKPKKEEVKKKGQKRGQLEQKYTALVLEPHESKVND